MVGSGGTAREHIERQLALGDSRALDVVAEQGLFREVVTARVEEKAVWRHGHRDPRRWLLRSVSTPEKAEGSEAAARAARPHHQPLLHHQLLWAYDSPSRENMGERDHVLLRVTAIDAERVKLHQLARVVFVDALELAVLSRRVGRGVLPIVEVEEHPWMLRGGPKQVAEAAHRMRPDRLFLVCACPQMAKPLGGKDVEMVEPERRHHFLQLARPVNRAHYARLGRFVHDDAALLASVLIGLFDLLNGHLELLEKLDRRHPQRLQRSNSIDQCGWLRDRFGVKLLMNIALGTYRLDAFDVAKTRTEAEPVQYVKRAGF